jgi:hypothetical protein
MSVEQHDPSALAKKLGYLGLIPFVGTAALLWVVELGLRPWLSITLASYAGLIASFLGGLHWGLAAQLPPQRRSFHYLWGVVPSIVASVALAMPIYAALPVLAVLLAVCYGVDKKTYPAAGWAAWLPMRLQLTVVAVLSCLLGAGA